MVQYKKGISLKAALEDFDPKASLEDQFKELAKFFLYGGYIHVISENVDRRIYIREVEFYYYNELNKHDENNDEKVYHRINSHYYTNVPNNPNLPIGVDTHYLKIGSLYLHSSGVDITFEKPNYRASALIRAFAIEENGEIQKIYRKGHYDCEKDERSTYIYEYLFEGLSIWGDSGFSINWEPNANWIDVSEVTSGIRINMGDNKKWRYIWKENK